MTAAQLEERVKRLEHLVDGLLTPRPTEPARDAWKATVGAFLGDPIAKEIIDEALRQREDERKQVSP